MRRKPLSHPKGLLSSAFAELLCCGRPAFSYRGSRVQSRGTRTVKESQVECPKSRNLKEGFSEKKLPFQSPTHLAQQQEPWNRLSSTPTVTSMRRDASFFDPKIPKDDLDFRLAALYDHHTGAFKNKTEILLHQETIQDISGCKIRFPGECFHPPPAPVTSLANIRHWINPKKESIHSIQGSIVSPHTAATIRGYSRKTDGSFFST